MLKKLLILILISISFASKLLAKTQFSSRYLDTSSDCTCTEKDLQDGQDCARLSCKEMAGFQIQTSVDGSAFDLGKLVIVKDSKELISLSEVPSKLEWRFAGQEPFAVIYRLIGPTKNCADQIGLPLSREVLVISGLGKYSAISGQVNAKAASANRKAREIADRGFLGEAKKRK